jgi:hypothetical protein
VPGITVGKIAEKMSRPGENLTNVVDRIRNWTDAGLLTPTGEKNRGTGKRRIYPRSALVEALILSVLTDAVGMTAIRGASFVRLFRIAKAELLAKTGPGPRFLTIGLSRDGRAEIGTSSTEGVAGLVAASEHESHVVIDLLKINERLNEGRLTYR